MAVFEYGGGIDEATQDERDGTEMENPVIANRTCGLCAKRFTRMGPNVVLCEMNQNVFGAMAHDGEFRSLVGVDQVASGW